jgi:hypothetical protein
LKFISIASSTKNTSKFVHLFFSMDEIFSRKISLQDTLSTRSSRGCRRLGAELVSCRRRAACGRVKEVDQNQRVPRSKPASGSEDD